MKKTLGLLIASLVVVALVGCKKTVPATQAQTKAQTKAATTAQATTQTATEEKLVKNESGVYTYNAATNSLPTAWNIHTYQANAATLVLDYTEDALYTFDYNEEKNGYKIVPAMAKEMPVDVTSQYVGRFGITEGETGKAYKIVLRDDLKFDNGKSITADDFIESVKLLLNPVAANYRADSVYSGNLKIYGAENYFKGGTYSYSEFVSEEYGDDEYIDPADFVTAGTDAHYQTADGMDVCLNIYSGGNWGSNSLYDYATYGYLDEPRTYSADGTRVKYASEDGTIIVWRTKDKVGDGEDADYVWYTTETGTETTTITYDAEAGYMSGETVVAWANCINPDSIIGKLMAAADEDGYVKLNATTLKLVQDAIAMLHDYDNVEAYAEKAGDYAYQEFEEMAFLGKQYDEYSWDGVGFIKDADGNLVIALTKSLTGFYLNYALCTSFYLVDTTLYKQCESQEQGVYANTYGTSVATYTGFGPYKLTTYVDGNVLKFEKNEYWYGYNLEENKDNYWTTNINIYQIATEAARLEKFLKGELDSYGLQAADMADYQSSKYTYFTEGDSTWFVAINPDEDALETMEASATPETEGNAVVKRILCIKDFRKALSFSVDRAAYALALDPLGGTAKALYGNMIISDPDNGTAYRTTEAAKDVILKFWGLDDEVGGDGLYETKDEAIASITGYDLAGAKALFNSAYDQAVTAGYITQDMITSGKWEIHIVIGQPGSGSSTYYNNGYTFLKKVWTEAVVGTKLEGHLTFEQSQPLGSTSFSSYLKNNTVDILFGVGWTGSALDPYGLMEAYVAPNYQYDPAWDTTAETLDIEVNGKVLRASVYDWGKTALSGEEIETKVVVNGEETSEIVKISCGTDCDATIRLNVLAAVEGAVLDQYDMIPINLDSSANLKGQKIKYGTEEYVFGVGRGGVKYMKYYYTDAEWTAYVAAQGGELNYKVSK